MSGALFDLCAARCVPRGLWRPSAFPQDTSLCEAVRVRKPMAPPLQSMTNPLSLERTPSPPLNIAASVFQEAFRQAFTSALLGASAPLGPLDAPHPAGPAVPGPVPGPAPAARTSPPPLAARANAPPPPSLRTPASPPPSSARAPAPAAPSAARADAPAAAAAPPAAPSHKLEDEMIQALRAWQEGDSLRPPPSIQARIHPEPQGTSAGTPTPAASKCPARPSVPPCGTSAAPAAEGAAGSAAPVAGEPAEPPVVWSGRGPFLRPIHAAHRRASLEQLTTNGGGGGGGRANFLSALCAGCCLCTHAAARVPSGGGGTLTPHPPPPPQTKVTIVGKTGIYNWDNLIGPFLVHKRLGPRPPPPPSPPPPSTQKTLWPTLWLRVQPLAAHAPHRPATTTTHGT